MQNEPIFTSAEGDRLSTLSRKKFNGTIRSDEVPTYNDLVEKKRIYDEYTANTPVNRVRDATKKVVDQRTRYDRAREELKLAEIALNAASEEQVEAEEALAKHNAYQKVKVEKLKELAEQEAVIEAQLASIRKKKEEVIRDVTPVLADTDGDSPKVVPRIV